MLLLLLVGKSWYNWLTKLAEKMIQQERKKLGRDRQK